MKTIDFTKPIRLTTSRAWRTYLGGKMISALHGEKGEDTNFPEEWLMSTVTARNAGREHIVEGISRVADTDLTLADLVATNPCEMLGAAHVAAHGKSLGVLVKLLEEILVFMLGFCFVGFILHLEHYRDILNAVVVIITENEVAL